MISEAGMSERDRLCLVSSFLRQLFPSLKPSERELEAALPFLLLLPFLLFGSVRSCKITRVTNPLSNKSSAWSSIGGGKMTWSVVRRAR